MQFSCSLHGQAPHFFILIFGLRIHAYTPILCFELVPQVLSGVLHTALPINDGLGPAAELTSKEQSASSILIDANWLWSIQFCLLLVHLGFTSTWICTKKLTQVVALHGRWHKWTFFSIICWFPGQPLVKAKCFLIIIKVGSLHRGFNQWWLKLANPSLLKVTQW